MAYTAVKGGEEAIRAAEKLENAALDCSGLTPDIVEKGMSYAVDSVMSEAGLYAPKLAARAVAQAQGDLAEAAFLLRAYRSTLPRVGYTETANPDSMRLIRRVSSAFKGVPGGQILGPTRDYSQRLLGLERQEYPPEDTVAGAEGEGELPRITSLLREAGMVAGQKPKNSREDPVDLTREALTVPAPRPARLQSLARGEAGAMTALAYSSLRGYGAVHPTLGEFRVGHLPLRVEHPYTGEMVEVGEIHCTEVESVGREMGYGGESESTGNAGVEVEGEPADDTGNGEEKAMSLGYGLVFGRNERKAIAMAILDAAIRAGGERADGPAGSAEDEEFVLYHSDGIEATGFVEHLKLPHYVTFQSSLDRLREVQGKAGAADED